MRVAAGENRCVSRRIRLRQDCTVQGGARSARQSCGDRARGIWLAGQDTSNLTEKDWCALRGASHRWCSRIRCPPLTRSIRSGSRLRRCSFCIRRVLRAESKKGPAAAAPRLLHPASLTDRGSTRESGRVPQDETQAKRVPRDASADKFMSRSELSSYQKAVRRRREDRNCRRIRQIAQTEMTSLSQKGRRRGATRRPRQWLCLRNWALMSLPSVRGSIRMNSAAACFAAYRNRAGDDRQTAAFDCG